MHTRRSAACAVSPRRLLLIILVVLDSIEIEGESIALREKERMILGWYGKLGELIKFSSFRSSERTFSLFLQIETSRFETDFDSVSLNEIFRVPMKSHAR